MSKPVTSLIGVRPHLVIMSGLFVVAAIVGYLLLPGEYERVAMLERDGNNREALRLLEERFAKGDKRQSTLFQLQRLYEHFGDIGKSRRILEIRAEQRPRDDHVQRQLADFYRATQDAPAHLAALRHMMTLRYDSSVCEELIGILRRAGAYGQEQKTIEKCVAAGYRRPEDLVRLAFLAASDGNLNQSADLLMQVDDRGRLSGDRQRMMLFEALLRTNRPRQARARAVGWLKGERNDALALTLIGWLARERRYKLAIGLARQASGQGDPVSLTVAETMLSQEQTVAARSYLYGWLKKTEFNEPGTVNRFVLAALDADDVELALAGAEKYGVIRLGQDELVVLAEALSAAGNVAQFDRIVEMTLAETRDGAPLLKAAIAGRAGRADDTLVILSSIKPEALTEWRQTLWRRLKSEADAAKAKAKKPRLRRSKRAASKRRRSRRRKIRRRRRREPAKEQAPSDFWPGINSSGPSAQSN